MKAMAVSVICLILAGCGPSVSERIDEANGNAEEALAMAEKANERAEEAEYRLQEIEDRLEAVEANKPD